MANLLIKNGKIIDGSGRPEYQADVLISDDKIEDIGFFENVEVETVIDAVGKVVCPGFIDVHSHADLTVHRADHPKDLEPLVRQGVTTFVGGNCGMSIAPIGTHHPKSSKEYLEAFTAFDFDKIVAWESVGELFDRVESQGSLLNWAMLVGHGMLRIDAMGMEGRPAKKHEIEFMSEELEKCLDEGAVGMSTGLQYFPGLKSTTEELVALGKTLKKRGAMFTSHLRSYSNTLGQAIGEVIEVASKNDIRAQVSHIFWVPDAGVFQPFFHGVTHILGEVARHVEVPVKLDGEIGRQLDRLGRSRKNGVEVRMDVMPTTTGFTHLLAFFPPWALEGDAAAVKERLRDPEQRKKMLRSIERGRMVWPHLEDDHWSLNMFKTMGWHSVWIMAVQSEQNKPLEGRQLVEIARERKKHPFEVACDLLLEEEGKVLIFEALTTPDDPFTERSSFAALADPETPITTDAILLGFGYPSYLFYGCYPKFFARYVREKKMLGLETAVRKCTGVPADHFQLKKRGYLRKGHYADVVVFDPLTIGTEAAFNKPAVYPKGIDCVLINGRRVVDGDRADLTNLAGRTLRGGG